MTDLLIARSQMAMSLGFHIVFAAVGIALPAMMVIAEALWAKTGRAEYYTLARRWATGSTILFAIGAVSGTVLSFELGLLWPHFMTAAGGAIGLLFSLEGFAFFTEAIFLGIYLHAWGRISTRAHLAAGALVAASGAASAMFVVAANGWMNTPAGVRYESGRLVDIEPWQVLLNPSAIGEGVHMILAACIATGFLVAGIHARVLLQQPDALFHRRALTLAFIVGAVPAMLQPLSGDLLAKAVAEHQPVKLAAFEAHFQTRAGAPFHLGGWPDMEAQSVPYSIEIPQALSVLLYTDPQATVRGLDRVPRDEWPPVPVVHAAFQLMVASGFALAGTAVWGAWRRWRRGAGWLESRLFLRVLMLLAPVGIIAMEAGWVVTEVGRQPWIISGIMKTADAVTSMPGLIVPFVVFTALYLVLGAIVALLIAREVRAIPCDAGRGTRDGEHRHAVA